MKELGSRQAGLGNQGTMGEIWALQQEPGRQSTQDALLKQISIQDLPLEMELLEKVPNKQNSVVVGLSMFAMN